ncbi:site-specific DNA-methyltransferase [Alkalilimnicola ehrlichii MLHE-1]|uniref:site-specific DNA-methyltransferase (adenine-specific) n=1 Tax=Alkalilimnicola ehrlichii (strain ATCC BAA-1101 / DSM 17681 / MLHE-1) TaxID=187272 RepID=Q0A8E9_ALKEH|nr:site-specific DNA-methyltransferase [Alkalilimnicola ehrlichii]ABI56888.1 DNA methylase N-4/N-6 domain protein [Alkalilimnicola ehrlichii MLHE-1]
MSQNPAFDKLIRLLKELFQLDQPDLDFGLYRIMHARADEISQFLDRDLLPQVKDAFSHYKTADKAGLEKELQQAIEQANGLGVDPETTAKVKELRQKIAEQGVDVTGLEQEVYDHLYKFFRRHYHEGDFLAKRVYKPGVYAIPYEGEEVKLHWANKDQYYIKTSEYLRDYAFILKPGADDPMRVHFRLVDAAEGEHGNVKEAEGKNRVFILAGEDFIAEENGEAGRELIIRFEYRPATMEDWSEDAKANATAAAKEKPPNQKDLREDAVRRVLAMQDDSLKPWLAELAKNHIKADGEQADYSRLAAHLNRYTARNTFDYFIHKDLGGFLRRELDFYIKNEVMHLDDIESETAPRVEQYLSKIKVIRQIAGKIIDLLAQLENFQKKLWLKKKFVTETSYCIRIGCIPEAFHPEIAANEAQRQEWVELHAIDELAADLTTVAYSEPLTAEFLRAHPTLMVDTRHFDDAFSQRLLEAVGDIDDQTDGVLFNSENFQALAVANMKYWGSVHVSYIDPPYNTELDRQSGKFIYKDNYARSTWASLMADRLQSGASFLREDGTFICSIDDNEYPTLREILNSVYGGDNFIGTIAWKSRDSVSSDHKISLNHNYHVAYAKDLVANKFGGFPLNPGDYSNPDNDPRGPWKPVPIDANKPGGETKYPIENPNTGDEHYPPNGRSWAFNRSRYDELLSDNRITFGIRGTGAPKRKLFLKERTEKGDVNTPVSIWPDAETTQGGTRQVMSLFGNKVFSYPKPVGLMRDLIRISHLNSNCVVADYFAGSGTTGHAIVNLNRADGSRRKFLLMEMGDYFDAVLLPRLKKVTFAPDWADGKPERLATEEEAECSPRIIKVIRLESYEDALNNLEPRRSETQSDLLASQQAQGADGLREQYLLRYWLDVETRGQQSLLNIDAFTDPTAYRLKVKRPGSEETREVNVDLLETFNWLIGLTVETIAAPQRVAAQFKRDDDPDLPKENPRRLLLDGRIREAEEGPWWFRTVTGTTPDGRKTLVIWRKLTGDPEQDNLVLDEWFKKQGYSSKDSEFDLIYVNGDNNLENLRQPDDTWKVRLIEEDFHRLMFEEAES